MEKKLLSHELKVSRTRWTLQFPMRGISPYPITPTHTKYCVLIHIHTICTMVSKTGCSLMLQINKACKLTACKSSKGSEAEKGVYFIIYQIHSKFACQLLSIGNFQAKTLKSITVRGEMCCLQITCAVKLSVRTILTHKQ